ncbi:MAG: phosphate acyltransferase PlsX [Methylococcales bacterium]
MSKSSIIALDAMGGDHGPSVVIPAALDSLKQDRQLKLILVGDEETIKRHLNSVDPDLLGRLDIKHASQRVEMDDLPSKVLRSKKDSSMRVAINLVKDGLADACVSAGNTGALMATARYVLKMIPGIDRPAIIGSVPSITGHTHVLDLGANVDCSAEHLLQFAVMGFELIKAVENKENPKVGLLNIGEEEIKGNEQVKTAAKLLSNSYLNFIGYVEGDAICKGGVDLIVTDGFVGNVSLKSIEGIAKMTNQLIKNAFSENLLTKVAGLIAFPVLKKFKDKVDHRLYNGASFLGLKGIVVKSHGNADRVAFANAIKIARLEVEKAVPKRIGEKVEAVFAQRKSA